MEREFPEGASEPPEGLTRRTMITLLGASLSMAGLAGCRRPEEAIVPFVDAPERMVPGVPRAYATTMPMGCSAYGLVVESHEGRPTKIEGNEKHPSTGGASSAFMQAEILNLYDPDRSKSVLHGGTPKSWDDLVAAWAGLEADLLASGGAGLAVLTESFSSPTLARLASAFRERFPSARWASYEAVSDENSDRGVAEATGSELVPVYRLERAQTILSLDCDFLLGESDSVRHAARFAGGRRVLSEHDGMNRLWVVEGVHSLTGANADHRLRLKSGDVAAFVALLAEALARHDPTLALPAVAAAALDGVDAAWVDALASDLLEHRGRGLILAGRRQPPAVHAAVLALNAALGNLGRAVTLREPADRQGSNLESLVDLVTAMRAGEVQTLIVLGGNPSYNAPADLDFAGALERVTHSIHLGDRIDETAAGCDWHVPRTHFLEAWGDARAVDGTLSVIQPLILPLFGGKSAVELLGLVATGEGRPGYDRVRETWQAPLTGDGFEIRWNRVLHDGLLAGSELPPVPVEVGADALRGLGRSAVSGTDLEVVFQASPTLHDGRYANNGWLQELPDMMTKLSWDNAVLLSPATAEALGVRGEDRVRLTLDERQLEMPAWIVPGQADGTVVLPLGYGRRAGGRVADGVGFDTYTLRTAGRADFGSGLRLEPTGARHALAPTQDHHAIDELGRVERERRSATLVRETTLEGYQGNPEFAHGHEAPHEESMWDEHAYDEGLQWGMTIDLNACTGCNACVVACQSENNIPVVGVDQVRRGREMHWLRIDRYFSGSAAEPQTVFQAVPCMQCENAPCEQVCPVAATVHDGEGLNVMVYNRCIGTRYCSNNCPYKVRRFNYYNFTKNTPEIVQLAQNPDVTVRSRGVMEKCTYCLQRISAARIDARLADRDVADGDVRTACQQACPSRAIEFGNILDHESRVARMKRQDRSYAPLEELYLRPRTSYLAKLRNPHPDLAGELGDGGHHG
jgi:molybdopterin-containing oxidoreductase family iron-sulfur binding subunit